MNIKKLISIIETFISAFKEAKANHNKSTEAPNSPVDEPKPSPSTNTAETLVPALEWAYGGVNGAKAKEDPSVVIGNFKLCRSGMSYSWVNSSLRAWGLADGDAGALACIFYEKGGKYYGGKFDWISSSRTTRDFKNIEGGYRGWNSQEFFDASHYAFCIMSSDGKKRTNLVFCDA